MANMTTILNQLSDFKFHDQKLKTFLGRRIHDFAVGFLSDIKDLHLAERSIRITLQDGRGDFWVQWYDDKSMYGCGCTVGCERCYLYWYEGEPPKSVKDRIGKVYDLFVLYLKVASAHKELKDKYDATLSDVIK